MLPWVLALLFFFFLSAPFSFSFLPVQKMAPRKNLTSPSSSSTDLNPDANLAPSLVQRIEQLEADNSRLRNELSATTRSTPTTRSTRSKTSLKKAEDKKKQTNDETTGGNFGDALWCDESECAVSDKTPTESLTERGLWLTGLLICQSCSGLILASNEALLQGHPAIIYFLTMLVGAGGNAGNQASVRVIRGLALGSITDKNQVAVVASEFRSAIILSSILSIVGFLRCVLFHTPLPETIAITGSLFLVVFISVVLGASLPLLMKKLGADPAHSSTSIQVIVSNTDNEASTIESPRENSRPVPRFHFSSSAPARGWSSTSSPLLLFLSPLLSLSPLSFVPFLSLFLSHFHPRAHEHGTHTHTLSHSHTHALTHYLSLAHSQPLALANRWTSWVSSSQLLRAAPCSTVPWGQS